MIVATYSLTFLAGGFGGLGLAYAGARNSTSNAASAACFITAITLAMLAVIVGSEG